jgi:carboxyl-terminal processing protease
VYISVPTSTTAASAITVAPIAEVVLTISSCATPPVTFGILCEVLQLVQSNHPNPPEEASMLSAAIAGVSQFQTSEIEEPPRGVECAVPSDAWTPFCERIIERLESEQVPLEDLVVSSVETMLANTVDPYTYYIPPEFVSGLGADGIIPGVGVVIAPLNAAGSQCVRVETVCPLQVVTVLGGSAAEQAGLLPGDHIEAIDGQSVLGMTLGEVAGALSGPADTVTVLDVARDGQGSQLSVTRADAAAIPVSAGIFGSVGYLRLPEFGLYSHEDVHFLLEELINAGATRLILDLRDNPGGYLFVTSVIGSEFLSSGLLYKVFSPLGDRDFPAVEGGIATRMPLVVLVNGSSASASEVLAAVLQERNRATIVGTPTFGKNLVQGEYELHNGGVLHLTEGTWTTPAGASVAGTGVIPDIHAEIGSHLSTVEVVEAVLSASG